MYPFSKNRSVPLGNMLAVMVCASVFLLALCKIEDSDAWIHLSMGRLIWENRGLPATEPFLFTMLGKPFTYSSWLFGLLYYAVYHFFAVFGVILLKAITVTAVFFIILRDSLRPSRNAVVAVVVCLAAAVLVRERFVERPDTFLLLFLSFSVFALNAYVRDGKNYLYALPLTHLLWANMHSSINLMVVPFAAFLVGGVLQRAASRRGIEFMDVPTPSQLQRILLVFLASFGASLISPYFLGQYVFGAQFLSSDWFKQEIVELKPPTWALHKGSMLFMGIVALSFIVNWRRPSFIHLLLVIPLVALAVLSRRFIYPLCVVSAPVLAQNLSAVVGRSPGWKRLLSGGTAAAAAALAVLVTTGLTLAQVPPFGNAEKEFGFGVNTSVVPEGALSYMDRRGIEGRIFNTFHWGQYITWRDSPKRTAYVDGRGVLSVDMLEKMSQARRFPSVLDELYKTYGFEALLLDYPVDTDGEVQTLSYDTDRVVSHPGWALVYWDDVSLLYLKREGKYDSVIKEDEYRFVRPGNQIEAASQRINSDQEFRTNLLRDVQRNIGSTGSSIAYALQGFIFNSVGRYREAIDSYSRVRHHLVRDYLPGAYSGIGVAYAHLGDPEQALSYYKRSARLSETASIEANIGFLYLQMGEKEKAIRYLRRGLELDETLSRVYPALIGAYEALGRKKEADATRDRFASVQQAGTGMEHFQAGLKAYSERQMQVAVAEFNKAIAAGIVQPAVYSDLGYIYFDMGLLDKAFEHQEKALALDPGYAIAHYGLAMVYKSKGENEKAKQHWQAYLKLEPAGYYSRRAKKELESLL